MVGIFVLLICLYALYVTYPIYRSLRESKILIRMASRYKQHPTNATTRILIAGDSIGAGVGAIDSNQSIAGRIGKEFPQAEVVNISASGIRLKQLNAKIREIPAQRFQYVILLIGANDVTHFTKLIDVRSQIQTLLTYASSMSDHVIVMTSGNIGAAPIFRWPISILLSNRTREVRAIFMREVQNWPHASYVDLYKDAVDEPFNTDIEKYYASDYFHPSADGYGLWYKAIQTVLTNK